MAAAEPLLSVHLLFDGLAALAAAAMTVFVYRWRLGEAGDRLGDAGVSYALALVAGAAIGGYGLGTLNLHLSGIPGAGRSILGALAGAILSVELYKLARGIRGSTGLIFVPAFATSVVVGRWGCFLSGLADHTHGTPTDLAWGHDFGDGIARHPVQLYESLAMAVFLAGFLAAIGRRNPFVMRNGFYLLAGWYALQRFAWEGLKPYAPVLGPLNLFHLAALAVFLYSAFMMARRGDERTRRVA
jgi:prolipoprotein diacylglyceryltransferase